ncbi:MAG: hydrogenase nickel incorporation protein HypB [Kiritimatiellales bacterium]|nr:hydrogenase nickel incorporation protein HypB [Kiritimatiellota bacterium]MBL7011472.1 hydrogenase nickel incorporation protein HypB [Kiritimatiellales bacterium]
MCTECGCGESNEHHHGHSHGHDHDHDHDHNHNHAERVVNVQQSVLAHNDHIALHNREALDARGVIAINLISSPGSGKTLLLEKTLEALNGKIKCAVITGDQQTDNDARRLANKGAKIYQIETKTSCHLNADQVAAALPEVLDDDTKILFIENVGNMVCPTAFELGEHFKVALLSTPEGEDKPEKYPVLFATAKLTLLTKMDLVDALDWDLKACQRSIQGVHPGMMTLKLSAKTGDGMKAWLDYLASLT